MSRSAWSSSDYAHPRRPGSWSAGLLIGARCLVRDPVLGLKRLILPANYWRSVEFAYARRQLRLPHGARVLDLGSPKELAIIAARHDGYAVTATDILAEEVTLCRRYAHALDLEGDGPGQVRAEVQDGRALTYGDNSFDAAFSVSVLEHIPGRGDSDAVRELIRVVKPGGVVIITTPYDRSYRETFLNRSVYERKQQDDEPVFFERHYDDATLDERLIRASGATLIDRQLWGEGGLRGERILTRLGPLRTLASPLEAALARVSLRRTDRGRGGYPMAAFLTLLKA